MARKPTTPKAIKMQPGDWVKGHKAAYFTQGYWLQGRITHVSRSGKSVEFKLDDGTLGVLLGRKQARFTYRPKLDRWLESGTRPTKDTDGLAMLRC